MTTPTAEELCAAATVVSLPMRVRFRGITAREALLLRGPAGWGEFAPFPEYDDTESVAWLRSAIEAAWIGPPPPRRRRVEVNATVPAVDAVRVPDVLARFPGARTAKVKVAERGGSLADDVARVTEVRRHVDQVRVDANGGWTVDEAVEALTALTAGGPLQYVEQPCATVAELVELRRLLTARGVAVPIAADESIRRADDPLRVVRAGAADVAVVKVAPLGGMRALLALADELVGHGVPIVVSSALDTAVGIGSGLAAAAALPVSDLACGLGTGGLFDADVAPPRTMVGGHLEVAAVSPDPARVEALTVSSERARWWVERMVRCHALL